MVLQALLEPLGLAVSFVENGLEAVQAAACAAFDLVLMDVQMPVMDGVSALEAIRALPGDVARIPVHMVTANVFEEDVKRYFAAGADGVLKKPVDVRELFALVERARSGCASAAPAEEEDGVERVARDASRH
jgi:CheY-like chemotaxis protein